MTGALGNQTSVLTTSQQPPVELYALLAKGALKCWFGREGSLKATHVFHAKVAPPSEGGAADIMLHTRSSNNTDAGALRAYSISITPTPAGSLVKAENVRFPQAVAAVMTDDVKRWLSADDSCSVAGTGGWSANTADAIPISTETNAKNATRPPKAR